MAAYPGQGCKGTGYSWLAADLVIEPRAICCSALVGFWPESEAPLAAGGGPLSLMSFVKHYGHG
jgi:hypothetical protein